MSPGAATQHGPSMVWDDEPCQIDGCDGELQQQDRFNVMCLDCETVWEHIKTEDQHVLRREGEHGALRPSKPRHTEVER